MVRLEDLIRAVESEVVGHSRYVIDYHAAIGSFPLDILRIHLLNMAIETCCEHIMLCGVALLTEAV